MSAIYAGNDIGGGARRVISDLNGSLGSRHFLYVMNERTGFASWASAFESSWLVIGLKWTSEHKVTCVYIAFEWKNDRFNCVVVRVMLEWMKCDQCFPSQPFVELTVDQFLGVVVAHLKRQKQDSHVYRKTCTLLLIFWKNQSRHYANDEV